MTEVNGASDATTTLRQQQKTSHLEQEMMLIQQLNEVQKYLKASWNERYWYSQSTSWNMDEAMEWDYKAQEQGITPRQTPSSSSTTQPPELSAALRHGPSEPVYLNTSTGEVPTP